MKDTLHGISEGVYTSRVHAAPDAVDHRTNQQSTARGNLAAIILERHGIDPRTIGPADLPETVRTELRELAEALGLDLPAPRRPGYCACGTPLAISAAGPKMGGYIRGKCLRCSRGAA